MSTPLWLNKYVGLPFADKGRTADGYDCWGLARAILADVFAIETPRFDDQYASHDSSDEVAALFNSEAINDWRRVEAGQEGDLLILRWKGKPQHVGVVYEPGWFVHAMQRAGVVRESYTTRKYAGHIWAILRHKSRCA